jgi:Tfp pilus assembly protein PilZ
MAGPRIQTRLDTWFEVGRLRAAGQVRNLGDGGLFVGSPAVPRKGDKVELSFGGADGSPVEVSGVVGWTTLDRRGSRHAAPGFGVRLVDAGEAYRSLLRRLRRRPRSARR